MAILDVFIVTQGLPSIKTTLGAGVADLELVVSAYSLVYAVFLITGGRLGDILDRKRIFLVGMTIFTAASALAGYAPSAVFLIGARALQGLGAALMYPQVLSIIQVTFKWSERALALGLFAAINGIGALTGNILGGLLIQTQRGRSLLETYLPRPHTRRHHRDPGRIPSSSPFQNGTSTQAGPARCWTDIPLSRLTDPSARRGSADRLAELDDNAPRISFPVLTLFVIYGPKRTNRAEDPLVDLDLFKHRSFAVGIPLTLLFYVTTSGFFSTFVLFSQAGLGFSPIISGLSFAQLNIGSSQLHSSGHDLSEASETASSASHTSYKQRV